MTFARSAVVAVAVAVATTGCGLGPGQSSSGEATLTVTRDYGATPVLEATEQEPAATETVIRFLDREGEITTRFGGGFVHSINGTAGEISGGRSSDWFFFVNGIESASGSAEVNVRGGDRIWWDFRDWTDALRTPAVVGSWPEPFLQASTPEDERIEVQVACMGARPPCNEVADRLDATGVEARIVNGGGDEDAARIQVGTFRDLAPDKVSHALALDPATSGVFAQARPSQPNGRLFTLDVEGDPVLELGDGDGLVAAVRPSEGPVTWIVTATGAAGVERAARALTEQDLADRYAIAVGAQGPIPLPDEAGG